MLCYSFSSCAYLWAPRMIIFDYFTKSNVHSTAISSDARTRNLHYALVFVGVPIGLQDAPHELDLCVLSIDDLAQNNFHVAQGIFFVKDVVAHHCPCLEERFGSRYGLLMVRDHGMDEERGG